MDNIEYEARILNINKSEFEKKLTKLGAEKEADYEQMRYTYDFQDLNPCEHKWIRLRKAGNETTLTIKKIRSENDIDGTEELEIKVSDFDMTNRILNELGYAPSNYQENKRTRYHLNGVEVDIDTWPLIPTFVEVEGKSVDEVVKTIALLGEKREDITTHDIQTIYLEKYGIDLSQIAFLKFENENKKCPVTAISGMPGAGKTTLSEQLIKEYPNMVFFDFGELYRNITYYLTQDGKMSVQEISDYLRDINPEDVFDIDFKVENGFCKIMINGCEFGKSSLYTPEMNQLTVDVGVALGDKMNYKVKEIIEQLRENSPVLLNARRPVESYGDIKNHIFLEATFDVRAKRKALQEGCSIEESISKSMNRDEKEKKGKFWDKYPFTTVIDTTNMTIEEVKEFAIQCIENGGQINEKGNLEKEGDER